jgi:hypothetical protein
MTPPGGGPDHFTPPSDDRPVTEKSATSPPNEESFTARVHRWILALLLIIYSSAGNLNEIVIVIVILGIPTVQTMILRVGSCG